MARVGSEPTGQRGAMILGRYTLLLLLLLLLLLRHARAIPRRRHKRIHWYFVPGRLLGLLGAESVIVHHSCRIFVFVLLLQTIGFFVQRWTGLSPFYKLQNRELVVSIWFVWPSKTQVRHGRRQAARQVVLCVSDRNNNHNNREQDFCFWSDRAERGATTKSSCAGHRSHRSLGQTYMLLVSVRPSLWCLNRSHTHIHETSQPSPR